MKLVVHFAWFDTMHAHFLTIFRSLVWCALIGFGNIWRWSKSPSRLSSPHSHDNCNRTEMLLSGKCKRVCIVQCACAGWQQQQQQKDANGCIRLRSVLTNTNLLCFQIGAASTMMIPYKCKFRLNVAHVHTGSLAYTRLLSFHFAYISILVFHFPCAVRCYCFRSQHNNTSHVILCSLNRIQYMQICDRLKGMTNKSFDCIYARIHIYFPLTNGLTESCNSAAYCDILSIQIIPWSVRCLFASVLQNTSVLSKVNAIRWEFQLINAKIINLLPFYHIF